jgi:hypothetical protein
MAKVSTNEGSLMRRGGSPSRDVPAITNGRPLSPKAVDALYRQGKQFPKEMKAEDREAPQRLGDPSNQRGKLNDVPESSWLRGGGRAGEDYAAFDTGKFDVANKPPKPPGGLKASGQNMHKSPFSSAYIKPNFNRS